MAEVVFLVNILYLHCSRRKGVPGHTGPRVPTKHAHNKYYFSLQSVSLCNCGFTYGNWVWKEGLALSVSVALVDCCETRALKCSLSIFFGHVFIFN